MLCETFVSIQSIYLGICTFVLSHNAKCLSYRRLLYSLKAFARENLLSVLQMVMLAQPWPGFDFMLSWFSAVVAVVPKAITHFHAQGPFCLCWLLHQDFRLSRWNYITAFPFPVVVFYHPCQMSTQACV